MDKMSPYEKVTAAVLSPVRGRGRTKDLLQRTPTKIRELIRQSDQLLAEIEELNLKNILVMPDPLRVRLFHFLLRCDLESNILAKLEDSGSIKIPSLVAVGQSWIFMAQERLFGIVTDEDYQLEE